MAQQLQVDIDVMRSAQGMFTRGLETAQGIQRSVQAVSGSISGVWSGGASTTYQGTLNEWNTQYARVVASLQHLCSALDGSIKHLQQAEVAAQQLSQQS